MMRKKVEKVALLVALLVTLLASQSILGGHALAQDYVPHLDKSKFYMTLTYREVAIPGMGEDLGVAPKGYTATLSIEDAHGIPESNCQGSFTIDQVEMEVSHWAKEKGYCSFTLSWDAPFEPIHHYRISEKNSPSLDYYVAIEPMTVDQVSFPSQTQRLSGLDITLLSGSLGPRESVELVMGREDRKEELLKLVLDPVMSQDRTRIQIAPLHLFAVPFGKAILYMGRSMSIDLFFGRGGARTEYFLELGQFVLSPP